MDIQEIIRQVTEEVTEAAPAHTPEDKPTDIAKYIDHTYLKPEASVADILRICEEAKALHTASVCVNPSYIELVARFSRYPQACP